MWHLEWLTCRFLLSRRWGRPCRHAPKDRQKAKARERTRRNVSTHNVGSLWESNAAEHVRCGKLETELLVGLALAVVFSLRPLSLSKQNC